MSEINLAEVQDAGRPFLKNGEYILRCIACVFGKSKKQNKMFTYTFEICSPETVMAAQKDRSEKSVKIAGIQVMHWITFDPQYGLPKLKDLHAKAGIPMTIDADNPNTKVYIGKALKVSLTTEQEALKDENTGEAMVNDKGEPELVNNYRIQRFISLDTAHTMAADSMAF